MAWEQARMDEVLADVFGFHALQTGVIGIDALRSNRMPQRWLAGLPGDPEAHDPYSQDPGQPHPAVSLYCDAESLPFPDGSLDLVVMPHTLELACDAHRALAEAVRALRPEGHLVITGFNPMGPWGWRHRLVRRFGLRAPSGRRGFLPCEGEMIGYWRLRDWLKLLDLDIEQAHMGGYRLPFRSQAWLGRFQGLESLGQRWWPVLGAVYCLVAVKRVRGVRLVGLARPAPAKSRAASRAVASRQGQHRMEPQEATNSGASPQP